jgi:hypothetical protein
MTGNQPHCENRELDLYALFDLFAFEVMFHQMFFSGPETQLPRDAAIGDAGNQNRFTGDAVVNPAVSHQNLIESLAQ